MKEIKKMSVAEFRRLGYLQELNRRFLHPLGLALEVVILDDGEEKFGEVWDCRDQIDGMIYDSGIINAEKAERIDWELETKKTKRLEILGYAIQPVNSDFPAMNETPFNMPKDFYEH